MGEHASSLSIESLRPEHAGTYVCTASNAAARADHASQLIVNGTVFVVGPVSAGFSRAQLGCQAKPAPVCLFVFPRQDLGASPGWRSACV